ncbi:MAG: SBBP repeat-containing protein [Candidatus Hodarchaeales archaeon]
MKRYKIYLIGLIFLLNFSFSHQGTNINVSNQDDKADRNIVPLLTASNSVAYGWYRTWGGSSYDSARGVAADSSGNVLLAGFTESFGVGGRAMILVKYNGNGVQQWSRIWGGSIGDDGYGVTVDSSGSIYLAGETSSFGVGGRDMILVKYDGNGVQQWNYTWGGSSYDSARGVAADSSGNVLLAGGTQSFGAGSYDMVLVKYDGNGIQQLNRTWGGGSSDNAYGVAVDSSGNIYLAGFTESFGAGDSDMVLVKYDGNGEQQWNRTWGGGSRDDAYGVAVDSSGNIYLAGETYSFGAGDSDMVLVKYDGNGIQQWNHTWGGDRSDDAYGVAVDSSGNIFLAGYTWNFGVEIVDMVLVKYDGSGEQQWNRTWGGDSWDIGLGVVVDSSGNIYLAGETHSFGVGSSDMVLVKLVDNESLERPPPDSVIMIVIIVSIVSVVGISIVITFFIKKFRNN